MDVMLISAAIQESESFKINFERLQLESLRRNVPDAPRLDRLPRYERILGAILTEP
jgi:hypothetical protein